jgi:phage-related protein (TIGR01555 family)
MNRAATLAKKAMDLEKANRELRNSINLKKEFKTASLQNSLTSLMMGGGAAIQSPLTSFNNLAQFNIYSPYTLQYTMLCYMYKTHGLLQTAIDMPVMDALRGGVEITCDQMDGDDIQQLQRRLETSNAFASIAETAIWARLFGGAGLVINTDYGDMSTPLREKNITNLAFYAAARWEASSVNRYSEYYEFYGKKLHHSRFITMAGKAAPYFIKFVLQGWGMSEMERMIEPFNMYLRMKDVIYELMREAKIDVYRLKNFTDQLVTNAGTEATRARLSLMNTAKSFQNAIVMDKEDEFEQKQITFAGLAEMDQNNQKYIASALRMPMSKLFGISAQGFGSGEDDIENYNAMVESEVRQPIRPLIRKVIDLFCVQEFGTVFEDLRFSFKPLRVIGAVEEETIKTQKFNRFSTLYSQGIMDPQEYAKLCHDDGLLPIETAVAKGSDPHDLSGGAMGEGDDGDPDESEEEPGDAQ